MAGTVEDSNEKHLAPWSAACERDGIHTTPLSPYLDQVRWLCLQINIVTGKIKCQCHSRVFIATLQLNEWLKNNERTNEWMNNGICIECLLHYWIQIQLVHCYIGGRQVLSPLRHPYSAKENRHYFVSTEKGKFDKSLLSVYTFIFGNNNNNREQDPSSSPCCSLIFSLTRSRVRSLNSLGKTTHVTHLQLHQPQNTIVNVHMDVHSRIFLF